jgi:hypothetical protein
VSEDRHGQGRSIALDAATGLCPRLERCSLHKLAEGVARHRILRYESLRRWSVADIEAFWASIWDYFKVVSSTPYKQVLDRRVMPGAKWFEGSRVNYAEHLLRYEACAAASEIALHHVSETRPLKTMSWNELARQVRILATQLRKLGLRSGDRVVSYMPNVPEAAVAMMAVTAIGAIWSAAARRNSGLRRLSTDSRKSSRSCCSPPTAIGSAARISRARRRFIVSPAS